jgi:hypothetical protein
MYLTNCCCTHLMISRERINMMPRIFYNPPGQQNMMPRIFYNPPGQHHTCNVHVDVPASNSIFVEFFCDFFFSTELNLCKKALRESKRWGNWAKTLSYLLRHAYIPYDQLDSKIRILRVLQLAPSLGAIKTVLSDAANSAHAHHALCSSSVSIHIIQASENYWRGSLFNLKTLHRKPVQWSPLTNSPPSNTTTTVQCMLQKLQDVRDCANSSKTAQL